MLNLHAIPNSAAAKAYYGQSDYYLEGEQHGAHWHGKGAGLLGLSGAIEQAHFELLCENRHPLLLDKYGHPAQLTAKHIANRRVGYDMTFSLPKSVSLAYALGGDERVVQAFRESVAETMAEMEREMATRVRKAGKDEDRRTGNMIWADFLHTTSRPINGQPDPQLHIHAVVFNATFDHEEGQWKAGQFGDLKANAPYFAAAWRSRLSTKLQGLGYEVRKTKDAFEIVGVPERAIKEFSRRTALIEKTAASLGISRPETKAKLGATTREAKTKGLSWDDLQRLWKERLRPGELQAIQGAAKPRRAPAIDNKAALDWAILHAYERDSVVSERALVTHALKHGIGTSTVEGIYAEVAKDKRLIRREENGRTLVTTHDLRKEEEAIKAFAIKGRGKHRPLGRPGAKPPETLVPGEHKPPSPSQIAAMRHLWTSPDKIIEWEGKAGVGKTETLQAALAQIDVPWGVFATGSGASRGVLRDAGIANANTIAFLLDNEETQNRLRGGLIVIDELSQTGSAEFRQVCELANRLNARLLVIGDPSQHKSVPRGDVFALLDRAGLPRASISEIKRQSGEYRKAVEALSKGDVVQGFNRLDDLGWVKQAGHDALVADYLAAKAADKSVLIVSPTHAVGEEITSLLRAKLKDEAKLGTDERTFDTLAPLHLTQAERQAGAAEGTVAVFVRACGQIKAGGRVVVTAENREALGKLADKWAAYAPAKIALAKGDQVRVTANGWDVTGEHRLNNGAVYDVAGFTSGGDVRLSNGWTVSKGFAHLTHGYVVTSHASQGKTVDKVFIAMPEATFGAVGKEAFYVSVSRGRHSATVYTDDKLALASAIHREDRRMLASDLVRVPRQRIMAALKKRVAFLRRVANLGRGPWQDRTKERGVTIERW
jgi:conjugative relaxase-like TrwC/TraI family protein